MARLLLLKKLTHLFLKSNVNARQTVISKENVNANGKTNNTEQHMINATVHYVFMKVLHKERLPLKANIFYCTTPLKITLL